MSDMGMHPITHILLKRAGWSQHRPYFIFKTCPIYPICPIQSIFIPNGAIWETKQLEKEKGLWKDNKQIEK